MCNLILAWWFRILCMRAMCLRYSLCATCFAILESCNLHVCRGAPSVAQSDTTWALVVSSRTSRRGNTEF